MTINELEQNIRGQLTGGSTFGFSADEFGEENPVEVLISDYFSGGRMEIHDAAISRAGQSVIVRGESSLRKIPLTNQDIEAAFHLVEGNPALRFSMDTGASESAPWKFTETFPEADDTLFNELEFSEARFIVDSHAGLNGSALEPGINFEGTLHNWEPWPALQLLAVVLGELKVTGTVKIVRGLPEIHLSMPLGNGQSFSFVNLLLEPEFIAEVMAMNSDDIDEPSVFPNPHVVSYSRLRTVLQYPRQVDAGGRPIEFPAWISLDSAQDKVVTIAADLTDFDVVNMRDLNKLIPNFTLGEILPPALQESFAFKLNTLSVTVNGSRRQIEDVSFGLDCNVSLQQIAQHYLPEGQSLPNGTPEVALTSMSLSVSPATKAFSLAVGARGAFEFPFTNTEAELDTIQFTVSRGPSRRVIDTIVPGPMSYSLFVGGTTSLEITDGLTMNHMEVSYNLSDEEEGESSWALEGKVGVRVIDHDFELSVDVASSEGETQVGLEWSDEDGIEVLSLEDFGSLTLSRMHLLFSPGQRSGDARNTSEWVLTGEGTLEMTDVFTATGALQLLHTNTKKGLVMDFQDAHGSFDVPLAPGQSTEKLTFGFGPDSIEIVQEDGIGWQFAANASFSIDGLMKEIDDVLPDEVEGFFKASKASLSFGIDSLLDAAEIEIPAIDSGSSTLDLGTFFVDIGEIAVVLSKTTKSMTAVARLGLPSNLNDIFGREENGALRADIFETFDPNDKENTTIKFAFTAGTRGAMSLQWEEGSIFKAVKVEDGKLKCDMGEFGAIDIDMPRFTYFANKNSFEAAGGFKIVRQLQVPLTPIKALLKEAGLDIVSDQLPDGIPIEGIDFFDSDGKFNAPQFISSMESSTGVDLPQWIKDGLGRAGNALERLPIGFKEYLQVEIPDELHFDISVVRGGNMSFGINTYEYDPSLDKSRAEQKEGADPLRMAFFGIVPGLLPLPGFNCLQLRRIAFGPLVGGSLFQMEVDAIWDQFDIATLAASLLLPRDPGFPLPTSDEIKRRMIFEDLFMIIIYQTGIPIPVPIFYDKTGLNYKGVEGIGLQGHLEFKQPDIGLSAIGEFMKDIKPFFTDPDAELDPTSPPGGVNLVLEMKDTHFELPEYLGSKKLIDEDTVFTFDAWENVAPLLNWAKKPTVNALIKGIPLSDRFGTGDGSFFFLDYSYDYVLSTPKEFGEVAFRQLKAASDSRGDDDFVQDFMSVLPVIADDGTVDTQETGVIAFLRGSLDVADALKLEAVVGVGASGTDGFMAGFQFRGSVLDDLVVMQLGGTVGMSLPGGGSPLPDFLLAGRGHFDVLGQRVLEASMVRQRDRFLLSGRFDLSPVDEIILNGNVDCLFIQKSAILPTETEFSIRGGVNFGLFGFTLAKANLLVTQDVFEVTGEFFDKALTTAVKLSKQNNALRFDFDLVFDHTLDFGVITDALGIDLGSWDKVDINITAGIGFGLSTEAAMASLRLNLSINGKTLLPINIEIAIDFGDLLNTILEAIKKAALDLFNGVFETAAEWAKAIGEGLVEFAEGAEEAAKVLKESFDVVGDGISDGAKEAVKLLDKAGFSPEDITKSLATVYEKTEEEIVEIAEDLGEGFEDLGEGIVGAVEDLGDFFVGLFGGGDDS